jgi:Flp pilus assembly protein TadG
VKVSFPPINAVKSPWRWFAGDRTAIATVEFAILVPLFTAVVIGVAQGGLLFFDEIELANAASVGSRTFAVSRWPSCPGCTAQPYTNTINAIANSGSLRLGASNLTLAVGGTSCTSDATCRASLNNAFTSGRYYSATSMTTVIVSYPCPEFLPVKWMPLTAICSGGNLSVTTSQPVQ